MAIYQFVIEFIPEIWAQNNNYDARLLFDLDQYDLSVPWENYKISEDLNNTISEILPMSKSWHQNLITWGNEEHSDIQIWVQDCSLESITIRLDLRDTKNELVNKIISLAIKLKCVLFLPESKQIIKPEVSLLYEIITKSSAAQYVDNPAKYLGNITNND